MKAYLSTDWHFGVYPLNLNKWMKVQLDYFNKQMIPYLRENAQEGDIFIMLGDLFNDRNNIPIITLNVVEDLLTEIASILPVHLILGNHDLWNKGSNDVNTPRIFKWIPNVNIYEKTHTLEIDGKKLVLMPWVEKRDDLIKEIQLNKGNYLFCHSDLNGCQMHLSSVAHRNKNKIDVEDFSLYERVFSGHIHIRQIHKNFEFIGAPYQMDRNDYNDTKGMTILDIDTGNTEFVENIISPTFKQIILKEDDDIDKLELVDTNKHYVDLVIHNSLLIGKRKNKKNLDSILGKKNFTKIEYVNDLIKNTHQEQGELKQVEINLDDIKIDDFGVVIKNFVSQQEYPEPAHKEGTIGALNEVLFIYEKQYKYKKDD